MKLVPSLVVHPSNATAAFHSTGETWGMRKRQIPGDRVITNAPVLLLLAETSISIVSAGQSDAPPRGVAVYVRDFEMSAAPATAPDPPSAAWRERSSKLAGTQTASVFCQIMQEERDWYLAQLRRRMDT